MQEKLLLTVRQLAPSLLSGYMKNYFLSFALVQVGGVTRDTCAETGPWLGSGPFNVSIIKNLNFHQATAIVEDSLSLYVRMVKL